MKRMALAAALAAVLTIGFADRASAQGFYQYGTTRINPYNGTVMNNRTVVTPFSAQSQSSYYNPYFGFSGQQMQYRNTWGTSYNRGYGTSLYGGGYNYGYYAPGFGSPYRSGYGYRW